jgi:hypothetical protein
MKSPMRVVLLLATLLFLVQCSTTKPLIRTIQTNADSTIAVELNPDSRGNGIILTCGENLCTVLTAAHLCNPYILFDDIMSGVVSKEIPSALAAQQLGFYVDLLSKKQFCSGFAVLDDGEKLVPFTPILIDFKKDLMLGAIMLSGTESTVRLSTIKAVEPGTELYTVVIAPSMNDKHVLFSRAGLTREAFLRDDTEKKNGKIYLQTEFSVGPGASGAPVFLLKNNLLVGILDAQLTDGDFFAPIRATFIVTPEDIRDFYRRYTEDIENDSKSDWPYCYGEEQLCKLVQNKTSLMDALRHRGSKEAGEGEVPADTNQDGGVDGVGPGQVDGGS